MKDDIIEDEARKYANRCSFKEDVPFDWWSAFYGYKDGYKDANKASTQNEDLQHKCYECNSINLIPTEYRCNECNHTGCFE